jgi:hypothetical protein
VETLEGSLRAGKVRLDPAEVVDSTTRLTLSGTDLALASSALRGELASLRAGREGGAHATGAPFATTSSVLADPVLRRIADLRSGRLERIREALSEAEPPVPALVAHLVPLLARNDLYLDVLRALRRVAPRVAGQLLDALLDPEVDPVVRRRLPRVLKACATRRVRDGLAQGLEDPSPKVRHECARALAALSAQRPELRIADELAFGAARRELEWGPDAGLDHAFTLLGLVLEREPLEIAALAVRGQDAALRGTALEYLENVLPDEVRVALWPHLGVAPRAGGARPRQELITELLRAGAGLRTARGLIRRRP